MTKSRDLTLDIAKAICIILMVVGHSGCPDYLRRFIYMFHMPCFFFISGWLLNDKYLADVRNGLKRKAKGSYWPFIKWQLIFLACHNLFAAVHVYDDTYTLSQFAEKTIRVFTMTGGESLLGGYWFLISLFWASVFSLLFLSVLNKKISPPHLGRKLIILILLLTILEGALPFALPQQFGQQTLLSTAFYMSGYFYKKQRTDTDSISKTIGVCLLLIPAVAAIFVYWGMVEVTGVKILFYFIIAQAGTFGVISLSQYLSKHRFKSVFAYIGNKSLYILTFHFLAFKLVSFLYIQQYGLPMSLLSQSPVLKESSDWLWLVYSIVGVAFSVLVWEAFHRVSQLLKQNK